MLVHLYCFSPDARVRMSRHTRQREQAAEIPNLRGELKDRMNGMSRPAASGRRKVNNRHDVVKHRSATDGIDLSPGDIQVGITDRRPGCFLSKAQRALCRNTEVMRREQTVSPCHPLRMERC